jgi:hypothetical protein
MATDSIVSIPNRLLRYESNIHSKVPAKIKKEQGSFLHFTKR